MEQTEIDELRRLHAEASPGESAAFIPAAIEALPRLLAALEEARAERDKATQQQASFIGCLEELSNWPELAGVQYGVRILDPETMQTGIMAVEASKVVGIMEGIHRHATEMLGFGNRAVSALRDVEGLRIERDVANAERDRARQKIQAMEEQAMADEDGMSMRPLDGRLRKVEAERDALKEKLAALVEASHKAVMDAAVELAKALKAEPSLTISHEVRMRMRAILVLLNPALAAAKVQP